MRGNQNHDTDNFIERICCPLKVGHTVKDVSTIVARPVNNDLQNHFPGEEQVLMLIYYKAD
jgi:hypothetical protein